MKPETEKILYETHSHTPLCKHAIGDPSEYAQAAYDCGLRGLTVTCHNPMPNGYSAGVRMEMDQFQEYVDLVEQTRVQWDGRLDVRLGLECDYFPGYESWLEKQVTAADFHYILGSVHPQCREFYDKFWQDDPIDFQLSYFDQLAQTAEQGLFDCLSHPDLVKNETSTDWNPLKILDDIRAALDRIARTGIAMELNTSGLRKTISEMNPCPEILLEIRAREIPIVIGADAHDPGRVGDRFVEALDLLAKCGFESVSYFLERRRHDVPIHVARESLTTFAHSLS
jgi:histidinol-phosphatase (PHP family)